MSGDWVDLRGKRGRLQRPLGSPAIYIESDWTCLFNQNPLVSALSHCSTVTTGRRGVLSKLQMTCLIASTRDSWRIYSSRLFDIWYFYPLTYIRRCLQMSSWRESGFKRGVCLKFTIQWNRSFPKSLRRKIIVTLLSSAWICFSFMDSIR